MGGNVDDDIGLVGGGDGCHEIALGRNVDDGIVLCGGDGIEGDAPESLGVAVSGKDGVTVMDDVDCVFVKCSLAAGVAKDTDGEERIVLQGWKDVGVACGGWKLGDVEFAGVA